MHWQNTKRSTLSSVCPEYYEDSDKMDLLFARQGELQDIIDATDAWNLDSKLERAMDALRCPPLKISR